MGTGLGHGLGNTGRQRSEPGVRDRGSQGADGENEKPPAGHNQRLAEKGDYFSGTCLKKHLWGTMTGWDQQTDCRATDSVATADRL